MPAAVVPDMLALRAASNCRAGMLGMYILEPRMGQSRWHSIYLGGYICISTSREIEVKKINEPCKIENRQS